MQGHWLFSFTYFRTTNELKHLFSTDYDAAHKRLKRYKCAKWFGCLLFTLLQLVFALVLFEDVQMSNMRLAFVVLVLPFCLLFAVLIGISLFQIKKWTNDFPGVSVSKRSLVVHMAIYIALIPACISVVFGMTWMLIIASLFFDTIQIFVATRLWKLNGLASTINTDGYSFFERLKSTNEVAACECTVDSALDNTMESLNKSDR